MNTSMMKRYFYFAFVLFVLAACGGEKEKEVSSQFTIKGKIDHLSPQQVYLEALSASNEWIRVDTATLGTGGTYELKSKVEEPDVFRITWDRDYFFCIVDSNRQVIELNVDANSPYTSMSVKGSKATEQFIDFNKRLLKYNAAGDSLSVALKAASIKKDKREEEQLKLKATQQRSLFDNFVKSYIDSIIPSVTAILLIDYLDINTQLDFYIKVNTRFQKEAPNSKYATKLNERVSMFTATRFAPGHPAPDFVLYNPEGKEVKISQFKGKLLLLDFWASWCGPCRKENPNVVKLYKEYKSKGLEILSVSLDRERDPWLAAIETDGLKWNHGWDSDGKVSKLYHVESIPSTFLIDRDGKIIVQNLRGEALEQKVAEILK
jgi:peroxiredoxin